MEAADDWLDLLFGCSLFKVKHILRGAYGLFHYE